MFNQKIVRRALRKRMSKITIQNVVICKKEARKFELKEWARNLQIYGPRKKLEKA
jgi:hypothetical protein